MAKKIILFLSMAPQKLEERNYTCDAGVLGLEAPITVKGTLTNEAPVKAMLAAHRDIDSIICIVTKESRDNALELFKKHILEFADEYDIHLTDASFKDVTFHAGEEFTKKTLKEILEYIKPGNKNVSGNEILLETTGGWRDTMMYLLMLVRILRYNYNQTIAATYSNKDTGTDTGRITDVMPTINMFNLIDGMQEMSSFGSVSTLRKYFAAQPKDERIEKLLTSMENLNGAIELCRAASVKDAIDDFAKAVDGLKDCSNPLMRQLYPAFRSIYANKDSQIGQLIDWCLKRERYQQALTLYVECIPEFILTKVLQVKPGREKEAAGMFTYKYKCMKDKANEKEVELKYPDRLIEVLMKASEYGKTSTEDRGSIRLKWHDNNHFKNQLETIERWTSENLFHQAPYALDSKYTIKDMQDICRDYIYIKVLRNMVNHALGESDDRYALRELHDVDAKYYTDPNNITLQKIDKVMHRALVRLKLIKEEQK